MAVKVAGTAVAVGGTAVAVGGTAVAIPVGDGEYAAVAAGRGVFLGVRAAALSLLAETNAELAIELASTKAAISAKTIQRFIIISSGRRSVACALAFLSCLIYR
jgi:hypothetical protein